MKRTCMKCGEEITCQNSYTKNVCWGCRKAYMRELKQEPKWKEYNKEWMRTRRWLNGGKDSEGERYNNAIHPAYRMD